MFLFRAGMRQWARRKFGCQRERQASKLDFLLLRMRLFGMRYMHFGCTVNSTLEHPPSEAGPQPATFFFTNVPCWSPPHLPGLLGHWTSISTWLSIWIPTVPASEGRLPPGGAWEFISENGPVFTLNLLSGYTASEQTSGKWVESAEWLTPIELSTPHGFSYLEHSQLQEVRMPSPISQVETLNLRV